MISRGFIAAKRTQGNNKEGLLPVQVLTEEIKENKLNLNDVSCV